MMDILLIILFVSFVVYVLRQEQRLTLPVIEIRTGPQGTKVIVPPQLMIDITWHPVMGARGLRAWWLTWQLHQWLEPLFRKWGHLTLRRTPPPPLRPFPPGLPHSPAELVIYGEYDPENRQTWLIVHQRPPGWGTFWRLSNLPEPVKLPLIVLEPQVIRLSYRSLSEIRQVRRFLAAYFLNYGLRSPRKDLNLMNQILEELAVTPWALRPENRPVVAFYHALSRISFSPEEEEEENPYGWGGFLEPLAPYLRPTMVMGYNILDDQPPPAEVDHDLLARMYNLRAFIFSMDPLGVMAANALLDLERALALRPHFPEIYYLNQGAFYARRKAFDQALKAYEHPLKFYHTRPLAAYARAAIYYVLGDIPQARREILAGQDRFPDLMKPYVKELLAWADPDFPLKL